MFFSVTARVARSAVNLTAVDSDEKMIFLVVAARRAKPVTSPGAIGVLVEVSGFVRADDMIVGDANLLNGFVYRFDRSGNLFPNFFILRLEVVGELAEASNGVRFRTLSRLSLLSGLPADCGPRRGPLPVRSHTDTPKANMDALPVNRVIRVIRRPYFFSQEPRNKVYVPAILQGTSRLTHCHLGTLSISGQGS